MTYLPKNLAYFSDLDGMQAICAEKMSVEKVVPKHPFSLTAFGRFPFLSLRDIFPRSGGNRPSRGRLCAATAKFPTTAKAVPLGKVAASEVSRRKGCSPPRHRFRRKQARQLPIAVTPPSRENAMPERPQTLRHCSIKNNFSADYGQSARGGHLKSSRPWAALTASLPGQTDPLPLPRRPCCQRPPARRRTAHQTGRRPVP